MRRVRIENSSRGTVLAEQAEMADGFVTRGVGLMGRRGWSGSDGMVIEPCSSIHCFFMRMPIDVVFVDRDWRVLQTTAELKPWRIGPIVRKTRRVVELPSGTLKRAGIGAGDQLSLVASNEQDR
jgi:uncharacterized protein